MTDQKTAAMVFVMNWRGGNGGRKKWDNLVKRRKSQKEKDEKINTAKSLGRRVGITAEPRES